MIQRHGNTYIDPTNYVQYEQMQQDLNMSEQHEDEDSQDSNREDHSQNEYPDEEENNFSSNKS